MSDPKTSSVLSVSSVVSLDRKDATLLSIECGDEQFVLHAERAVYWPSAKTLIIADPHFGKAAAFRAAGVPVPEATTESNLERLNKLLMQTGSTRLVVLGDFLHAAAGRAEQTMCTI